MADLKEIKSVDVVGNSSDSISVSDDSSQDENARGTWGGKMEFLLSCVGYAVGLGNVWRFPYLAYRNGGGAFLIPYLIMLLICGIPLFFMELAFGQFASLGPISVWRCVPLFKGVGYGMVVVSFMVGIYYNMIIAWTLFYFFASLAKEVPWKGCINEWNTQLCASTRGVTNESVIHNFTSAMFPEVYEKRGLNTSYLDINWLMNKTSAFLYNVTCTGYNITHTVMDTKGRSVDLIRQEAACSLEQYDLKRLGDFNIKLVSPSEEYWDRRVLKRSSGIDETGMPLWDLTLCLLLAWIVIFLCLIKGVKSSGKVVYFTATFPYIVLTILLIRGALLEGAYDGIRFYMVPKWELLGSAKVWKDAATQIFYSLGVGFGGLQVMSSYNKFHNNCLLDAVLVSLINCCTSVYAGFAIFSMLGYMAKQTGVDVQDAATSGPGLAFIAYPEGLSTMEVAPLWSVLFFFMLFTLGLDSQFAMMEAVISGIVDEFAVFQGKWRKMIFTGVLCFSMFLLGLPLTCPGGIYWFQILDWYSASICLLVIVFFELVGIIYVYGFRNFLGDIELMLGHKPIKHWMYFLVCWLGLSPLAIVFIIIFSVVDYSAVTYEGYVYPAWGELIGWLVAASSMIMIPLWMLITFLQKSNLTQYARLAAKPESTWGPALKDDRGEDIRYRGSSADSHDNAAYAQSNTRL